MNRAYNKQIKEDVKTIKEYLKQFTELHAALSTDAAAFAARCRITNDIEQAELSELYEEVCHKTKLVLQLLDENSRLHELITSRRKRLPGLFRRIFPKKQRARLDEPTEVKIPPPLQSVSYKGVL